MSEASESCCSTIDVPRFVLRDLSLPSRVVLALFLSSVGFGYLSALVQLHFQGAAAGETLPGPKEVVDTYYGNEGGVVSQLERLLMTDEHKPFTGSGSMRSALTTKSAGWRKAIEKRAQANNTDLVKAEKSLRVERGGEAAVIVDWIRNGANEDAYKNDEYTLKGELLTLPITEKYVEEDGGVKKVRIRKMLDDRCVRCHSESSSSRANQYPLDDYQQVLDYCTPERVGGGMSLKKLAQTTHVHLLGFSMLYGLTGIIFTFTRYPGWLRLLVGPLPLVAQLADISCWWLGRVDPLFAKMILVTGGFVGMGLFAQILLGVWDLFDKQGRKALIVLLLLVGAVGLLVKEKVMDPYLIRERLGAAQTERTSGE